MLHSLDEYGVLITARQALQPSEKSKSFCELQMALGSTMQKVSQGLEEVLGVWGKITELRLPLSSQAESLRQAALRVSCLPLSRLGVQLLVALQSPQAGQLHIVKMFFQAPQQREVQDVTLE